MAKVDISLARADRLSRHGSVLPVLNSEQVDHDVITPSGANQVSDFAVPSTATDLIWVIQPRGADIRVTFADAPVAAAAEGGGWLVLDGQTLTRAAKSGHSAGVITAEAA